MPKNRLIVSQAVKQFREDYFNVRGETPETVSTWKAEYHSVFSKLPPRKAVTEELLRETILNTVANSRQRRRFTLSCSVLADFLGIEHSLRRLVGSYSCTKVNPKNIPDDETIARVFFTIPNLSWRFVYGLMAVYGLRNCEAFLSDFSGFPVVRVGKSKQGDERLVYPLYPEWFELFDLANGSLPKVNGRCNQDAGSRVTHAFHRYNIPFTPYSLRHAWARRSLEFGMDLTIASEMMGHSVRVHSEIYHAWLSQDVYQTAYEKLIANPDRPLPPSLGVLV